MLAFNIPRSIAAAIRNSAIGQPRTVPNYLGTFCTGDKPCAALRYSEYREAAHDLSPVRNVAK